MHKTVDISVEKDILEANRKIANQNAELLGKYDVYSIDFMGAIGSGKTLLIERILENLQDKGKKMDFEAFIIIVKKCI